MCRSLQQAGAKRHRFGVASGDIVDIQVEVHLLRFAIGPVRRDIVWRELKSETGRTIHVQRVPVVPNLDCALQEARPEGALGGEVRGITGGGITSIPPIARRIGAPAVCASSRRETGFPARDATSNRWIGASPLIDTSSLPAGCSPVTLPGQPQRRSTGADQPSGRGRPVPVATVPD